MCVYTAIQKFGISKIFNVFFNGVSYAHQGLYLFDQKYRKNSNYVKYNYIDINNNIHITNIGFLF